jgi:hypothetical protein
VVANLLTQLPITFESSDGAATHAPLIIASVGGSAPARYILDTGSEVHLLNEDLVDELGLSKIPGEEGVDHSGATMPSWDVGAVAMDLDGLEVQLPDCVSIPALPKFHEMGIRGGLSPQNLHPTAWTVIDTTANAQLLLVEAADDEMADYLRAPTAALKLLTLTRVREHPSLVVNAALEGFAEIPTMLNTGGKASEYSAAALPGLSAASIERLGGGVGGSDYWGGSVGRQTLLIGGARLPINSVKLREQMHDPQGIIGMDLLRGTVLAVARDVSRPVFWQIRIE